MHLFSCIFSYHFEWLKINHVPRIKPLCPFANWLHWNLEYSMVCKGLGVYIRVNTRSKENKNIHFFVFIHFLSIVLSTHVRTSIETGIFLIIFLIYMLNIGPNFYTKLKVLIHCKSLGTFDVNFYFNLQEKKESIPGV